MLKNTLNLARMYGSKVAAATAVMAASSAAMAQTSTGIDAVFDAISRDGISTKMVAFGVAIVGIALVLKGPDLAKRIIRKV